MEIKIARTDFEITACFPVMWELRPHISEEDFISRIRAQEKTGFIMAFVEESSGPVAVAGFRIDHNLAWGKFLYVDDLVSLPDQRSRGYGGALLTWLAERAARENCQQLHLDSGLQREHAHRFYEREGMEKAGYHFYLTLPPATTRGGASEG